METTARQSWRSALEGWAFPQRLVDAVVGDPYAWDPEVFARRDPADADASPTVAVVEELSRGGSVLDAGAGTGRLAIPLARRGHRVTAVERDPGMMQALSAAADRAGVEITRILGAWPVVAGNAGPHDVALSAHVVYDVPGIGGFVEALHRAARRAVVIEMTPRHPWSALAKYHRALHGLERPHRPTVDDFVAVVEEVTGITPERRYWSTASGHRFADLQELLAYYGRRLLVPAERSLDAAALLERDITRTGDGWLVLGSPEREMFTLWWRTA